jgi:hypothetical protein
VLVTKRKLRILDFDIENRPLSYWIPDKPTCEITAIASCWYDDVNSMELNLLGVTDTVTMLLNFSALYNEADMVTGHYIRMHDLPIINGALMEFGLPGLPPKLTCDTRLDMQKKGDIPATQEYLGEILGINIGKYHMSQHDWQTANRLDNLDATRKRVTTDVYQHMMLRGKMLELNLLKSPRMWYP